ncbi:hypothetical protein WAK64_06310 [Bacillus spongiae]|uniref:Uncharacterized protein n=1 Tax=Bacillus spongiae TaxID=2683610 RepID=A0ABU8HBG3_9BACI
MALWKIYVVSISELIVFLLLGLFLTVNVLRNVYENAGINFMGNVWVVWFGLTFILFGIYTILLSILISKDSPLLKNRLSSKTFWVLFIASIFGVFIPFFTGEIPF